MGLRARERDPELPALAGEARLRPPGPAEICELVAAHMKRPAAPAIVGASWDYARWKPGVSITSVYSVRFADGSEEPVVAKRYVDGKDRTLEFRPRNEENLAELCVRLRPRALLAEHSLLLWVPPADRVLRGLPVLLDRRKLGNLVTRSGIAPGGALKKRKTKYELLRYKPERRAVYRIDLCLRGAEQESLSLGARALPPTEAARVFESRTALDSAGGAELAPCLAGTNLRQGFLLEPWLDLTGFSGGNSATRARRASSWRGCTRCRRPPACAPCRWLRRSISTRFSPWTMSWPGFHAPPPLPPRARMSSATATSIPIRWHAWGTAAGS